MENHFPKKAVRLVLKDIGIEEKQLINLEVLLNLKNHKRVSDITYSYCVPSDQEKRKIIALDGLRKKLEVNIDLKKKFGKKNTYLDFLRENGLTIKGSEILYSREESLLILDGIDVYFH